MPVSLAPWRTFLIVPPATHTSYGAASSTRILAPFIFCLTRSASSALLRSAEQIGSPCPVALLAEDAHYRAFNSFNGPFLELQVLQVLSMLSMLCEYKRATAPQKTNRSRTWFCGHHQ